MSEHENDDLVTRMAGDLREVISWVQVALLIAAIYVALDAGQALTRHRWFSAFMSGVAATALAWSWCGMSSRKAHYERFRR